MGLATLAVLAIGAGAGIQAFGQIQQGKAADEQAKAEQAILEHNARLKEREAAAELERSREEARQFGKEGKVLQAKQQVGFAKGGVLTTVGTPALVLEETAQELEADRREILREGFLAESFRKDEASGLRFQGRAARVRGKNLKAASKLQAAGTLLSGAGQAGSLTFQSTAFGTKANSFARA